MDNTLLLNLSSQVATYKAMDVIANNLANMSTPGFKRESQQFQEYIEQLPATPGTAGPNALTFVKDGGVLRDVSQGAMDRTGAPFDLAISGKGYFQVQTANGVRYTRDGHFTLNADGEVVDDAGNALIGDGGPITVTPDDGDIHIASDGTVSGKNGQIGTVRLVGFADDGALTKEGGNLYTTTQQPQQDPGGTIQQGMLEASNVQPVIEMSKMIEVMRNYQATASLTQSQQQLQTQAIDKLGSFQSS